MTYKQASERGWQVRQGEKDTEIEFREVKSSADRTRPNWPDDRDEGRTSTDGGTDRDETRLVHRVYTVFNAKQMDGIPTYTPKQYSPFEVAQAGEQILQGSGAQNSTRPGRQGILRSRSGSYPSPAQGRVLRCRQLLRHCAS